MERFDTIVVGAGNGGMTGALKLAKAGQKVLLIERHNVPGGAGTTFIRGRYEFDVGLHTLYGIGTEEKKGLLGEIFEELGVFDKIDFIEQDEIFGLTIKGITDIGLPYQKEGFKQVLKQISPEESEAIDKFQQLMNDLTDEFYGLYTALGDEINSEKFPLLFKMGNRPGQEVLDEYFENPMIKTIYTMNFGYTGISIDKIPICILALMYDLTGGSHARGGAQSISNALVDEYEKCGGQVLLCTEVEKILVEDGKVTGVRVDDGRVFESDNVLCNAVKIRAYVDLIDEEHVPESVFDDIRVSTPGVSTFGFYAGLNCTAEELGMKHGVNYLVDPEEPQLRFDVAYNHPEIVSNGYMSCYNIDDPNYSEEGTCCITLLGASSLEPWLNMSTEEYHDTKFEFAQRQLDFLTRFYPKVKDHIEEFEMSTPVTHMRYLGSPGGAIYATQGNFKDLIANKMEVRSPIKGLYFSGSSVLVGGFNMTYMSGYHVARVLLEDVAKEVK